MTLLQPLGFYREFDIHDWSGPISEAVSEQPSADEDNIVGYLRQGLAFAVSPGIARDILSPDRKRIGAGHLLTDGRWVWLATLPYYVQTYHCRLPEEFVAELRNKNWLFPAASSIDLTQLRLPDAG